MIKHLAFLYFAFYASTALSYYDEFTIGSSADYFTLKKKDDGNFHLKHEAVQLGTFNDFIHLFGTKIEGACPKLKNKPDITIIAKRSVTTAIDESQVQESKREFYLDQKIVKAKEGCAPISGDGIYYLPMHRYWFTGETTLSLPKPQSIKIVKDEKILADARREKNQWQANDNMDGLNWDFFGSFVDSLQQFPVFARLHPAIGKGKPQFDITFNGDKYTAYYVAKNLWAIKFPKSPWLVASQAWSSWEDMRLALWRDRFFKKVEIIVDTQLDIKKREKALTSLGSSYTQSIKKALQKVLTNPNEPVDFRSQVLNHLKQRPSLDNFSAMIEALTTSDDRSFLRQLTHTLRIRNPKGPEIKEEFSDEEISRAISAWQTWWKKIDK